MKILDFTEFTKIGGDLVYVGKNAIKLVDIVNPNFIYIPDVSLEHEMQGFIQNNLIVIGNRVCYYTNSQWKYIAVDKYLGSAKFGFTCVVFYENDDVSTALIFTPTQERIIPISSLKVGAFKQVSPFSALLSYNQDNNSILGVYPVQPFAEALVDGNLNLVPEVWATFPRADGHEIFTSSSNNVIFATNQYTAFLELNIDPYAYLRTIDFVNYKQRLTEIFTFLSESFHNATFIGEFEGGYLFKSRDINAYIYKHKQTEALLYGKRYIPVSPQVVVEKQVTSITTYNMEFYPTPHAIPSTKFLQLKQSFGKPVVLDSLIVDFNYVTNYEAPIKLIVDTAYREMVRSFSLTIPPDHQEIKLGIRADRCIINLSCNYGLEVKGGLVYNTL